MALKLCLAPCPDGYEQNTPSSVLGRDGHSCMDRVAFCLPRLLLSGLELSSKEFHGAGWRGVGVGSLCHRARKAPVVPHCPKSFYFSVMSDNKTGPKPQL